MNAVELNDLNFDSEVKESAQPVLVDFYADWCGPCRKQLPIMDKVAQDYFGKVKVVKLNVDYARIKSAEFGVSSVPSLLVFKNGEVVEKLIGVHSNSQLSEIIDRYL